MTKHNQTKGKINVGFKEYVITCAGCNETTVDYQDTIIQFSNLLRDTGWRTKDNLWYCSICISTDTASKEENK
jgi:hypothetical protein